MLISPNEMHSIENKSQKAVRYVSVTSAPISVKPIYDEWLREEVLIKNNKKRKLAINLSEHSKEEIIDRVLKKAGNYFELCINCAQSTLAALQKEFNLGGNEGVLKAATLLT